MRLVFDLDGVLRDLSTYLVDRLGVPYPQEWFWNHDGRTIFDWIAADGYKALVYAPVTEFVVPLVQSGYPIELWTCQPDHWKPYTKLWIENNLGKVGVRYMTTAEKQKALSAETDALLIEDCPNFTDFSRILLVDRPYNQGINAQRISSRQDFLFHLERAIADMPAEQDTPPR